ncbi:hypothetical protein C0081_22815 [Cohaesibacter celericrescens]|uniref:Uncharacterized protein n=1 Tax=Cohaesibacter celericrescens TaxID=2067669 RepID=A0A2N5XL05_9HYPH|nr:hypothetical protein C0081_22815 [Cohaesibacter celericrescens]
MEAASNAVKSLLDRYFYSVKKGRYGRDWVEILGESTGKLLDQELEMAHARLLKEIKTHPPGRWEQSGVGNCWRRALAIFLASRHIARYQKIIGSLVPTPNNTSLVVVVADK